MRLRGVLLVLQTSSNGVTYVIEELVFSFAIAVNSSIDEGEMISICWDCASPAEGYRELGCY